MNRFSYLVVLLVVLLAAFARQAHAQIAAPKINSISGIANVDSGISNGLVAIPAGLGTNLNGSRAVNDQAGVYPWTLNGQGFGNQAGSVTLAGRSVPVVSWTNTTITINPTGAQINPAQPWNWGAMSTTLAVRTSDGRTVSQGLGISNALRTRLEGQCTQYCAFYRLSMGLQPSATAYGGYAPFAANYVPRRGDQYQWAVGQGKHCGMVDSVGAPVTVNGTTTFSIRIAQRNADARNSFSTFDTTFAVRNGVIVALPKFSNNSASATSYYR